MMKNILHISNYYLPNRGGIEQVAFDIVSKLKEDYNHEVICFSGDGNNYVDYFDDVKITRVGYLIKLASQALSITYYFSLRRILKDYKPDIIHFHLPNPLVGIYLLMVMKSSKAQLVLHWHSDIIKQKYLVYLFKPFQDLLLKKSWKIIVTSPNYATSKCLENYKDKVLVVPNTVSTSRFQLNNINLKNIQDIKDKYENKKIVLFVGRHVEYKGLDYLLKASSQLKTTNVQILIAGKGSLTSSLMERAKEDKKIKFIGSLTEEELKEHYYAADIFAFPSITKNEAFGVALAEAMYCNTPAITFQIEGSGVNWVNCADVTGLNVRNSDFIAYAEALDYLLINDVERAEMAKNARERVLEKFSIENLRRYLSEIY